MASLVLPLLLPHSLGQTDWENEVVRQEHRRDWEMKALAVPHHRRGWVSVVVVPPLPLLRSPGQTDLGNRASQEEHRRDWENGDVLLPPLHSHYQKDLLHGAVRED